ncbi:MAG: KH domain-containing protein [Erysipelotrichaceae bacterium]|nr:KH domain-containing protein [Erysipelotrichaceae bacterium]
MQKFEAKSVEEALKEACRVKGVTLDELKYYVIEEKPGGLFGIGSKGVVEAFTYNDVQQFLEQYVTAYFNNINMPVEVIVNRSENNEFKIIINADNNAILIGKNGQTLEAIKTIVNAAANATFRCHIHLSVDINGYKEERYEKLKQTVERIAKTVVKTKVSARLGDLTSDERKIVHQHLSEMPHVKTESEGEGNNRRLKIIYVDKK